MKRLYIILTFIVVLSSCNETLDRKDFASDGVVPVSFSVAPMDIPGEQTKSVPESVDDGTGLDYQVKDVWFFQFEPSGKRTGIPQYADMSDFSGALPVIIPENGNRNTGVFIANTHSESFFENNEDEFNTLSSTRDFLFGMSSEGYTDKGHVIMSGSCYINEWTQSLNITLYRSVACLDINIDNLEGSGVQINSIQVCNVQANAHYVESMFSEPGSSTVYPEKSNAINYKNESFSVSSGEKKHIRYFVSRNLRRNNFLVTTEAGKGVNAPEGATYVIFHATDTVTGNDFEYRIYPGENICNYDLKPNYRYFINLTIVDKGDWLTDNRIENDTDLLPESNCYLLHSDSDRTYHIPVLHRVNHFWESKWGQKYENSQNNILQANTLWLAEVIWQDQPTRMIDFEDRYGNKDLFKGRFGDAISFRIRPGVEGNVLIGMRLKDSDPATDGYLWTWHLWITEYDPDELQFAAEGACSYPVTGGCVNTYYNDYYPNSWKSGNSYCGKCLMDRNLGAIRADRYSELKDVSGLYYSGGRLTPFSRYQVYDINGSSVDFDGANHRSFKVDPSASYLFDGIRFPSVCFFPSSSYYDSTAGRWIYGWLIDTPSGMWSDIDGTSSWNGEKSFLDPCPAGWKMMYSYVIPYDYYKRNRWYYNQTLAEPIDIEGGLSGITLFNSFAGESTDAKTFFPFTLSEYPDNYNIPSSGRVWSYSSSSGNYFDVLYLQEQHGTSDYLPYTQYWSHGSLYSKYIAPTRCMKSL